MLCMLLQVVKSRRVVLPITYILTCTEARVGFSNASYVTMEGVPELVVTVQLQSSLESIIGTISGSFMVSLSSGGTATS